MLKILQKHYHNKIKLIYIDPPYNTGKDFVYPDNFREGLETYLEWTRQVNEQGKPVSSNKETEGRYHSNWLNMMYPRLKLARNLLADDGVIFISIDDNEVANLWRLCDEVFGEGNFLGSIAWESKTKTQNTKDSFNKLQPKVEYILVYTRRLGRRFNLVHTGSKRYGSSDEQGMFRWHLIEPMNATGVRGRESMIFPILGVMPPTGKQWQLGKETIQSATDRDEVRIEGGKPYIKIRPDDERSEITEPFWGFLQKTMGTAESAKKELNDILGQHGFETVKPVKVIKKLVSHAADKESVILDFFAGSATTAHAVMQLNAENDGKRRFIMVQLPEPTPDDSEARKAGFKTIADISRKRIELAGAKIKADSPLTTQELDTGFRAYKLADTNFAKWRVSSDVTPNQLEQHLLDLRDSADDNATADDLLTEILLKIGFPLTAKIDQAKIAGLNVRWVGTEQGENLVLAYLDEHVKPGLEQLRALVAKEPARLIVLEDAFHGDDELKTNLAQECQSRNIELWTA